jgi:hypothetical protein
MSQPNKPRPLVVSLRHSLCGQAVTLDVWHHGAAANPTGS